MHLHRTLLICLTVFTCNHHSFSLATATGTNPDQTAKSAVVVENQYRYLRTSKNTANLSVSNSKSAMDKSRQNNVGSRRNDVTYEVDSDTGSIYISGEKFDDTANESSPVFTSSDDFFVQACNGF